MPGPKCAVKSCRRRAPDVGVSFHQVPHNPFWTRQWNDAVGFTLPRNGRVCSDHFRVGDYHELLYSKKPRSRRRLKGNAVPSVSLGTVLDDSMVQPGCESMDVGANVDVDTCCSMLHDPQLVVDDSTGQTGCESMDFGANVDGDTCCSMLHDPEQCQTNTRRSSSQTDGNVSCADCSLCSGTGNTSRPGLLFAPPSVSTPFKRADADHSMASAPATPQRGRTTPFNDTNDTSYHPSSDDSMDGTALHQESKYIVFDSCLWQLLSVCDQCGDTCTIRKHTKGTSLTVKARCFLGHEKAWCSQPTTNGMAAGNVLLAGAILFSGASAIKVLRLLASVNIEVFTAAAYNIYQKGCLVPAITKLMQHRLLQSWNHVVFQVQVWTTQQASLVEACKGRELHLLGDGRCDSPGHSAKYLTYTLMDADSKKVLNFTQVQVGQDSQVKTSPQMEKVGFVQCLREVRSKGLEVSSVTTDRHPGIRKYIREEEPGLKHGLDSWHVVKGLTRHIVNLHSGHEGPYHRYLHEQLSHKDWLDPGSEVYKKLCGTVLNARLLKDIEQLSSDAQTSCLEGYHSLMIRFAPKSVAHSPALMSARTMLAVLHHNANTTRQQACGSDGEPLFKRKLLKSKKGNEVVCPVKESATYDYVQQLLEAAMEESCSESYQSMKEQKTDPGPPPMTAAYTRLPKEALVSRRMLHFKS
ncbi:hypothetical protein MTO96_050460 [Rhipicephalus appendiculatus]